MMAGTVFSEVIVHVSGEEKPLHRLEGHKVRYNSDVKVVLMLHLLDYIRFDDLKIFCCLLNLLYL